MVRLSVNTRHRAGPLAVWTILVLAGLTACADSFKQDSDPHAIVVSVDSLPIPDTMTRTQVTRAAVAVESSDGETIAGATVSWQSSDDRVVRVDPSDRSDRARLTAVGLGQAEITISIDTGIGAVPHTVLRDTVRVLERWRSVSVGRGQACGINVDSIPYCWGFGGVLGDGTTTGRSAEPVKVGGLLDFPARHLELGDATTCVTVLQGVVVYCWGANSAGEMGNQDNSPSLVPRQGLNGAPFSLRSLSAGGAFFCGTFQDPDYVEEIPDYVFCWGINSYGQLGMTANTTSCTVNYRTYDCVLGPGLTMFDADSMSAGESHACAIQGFDVFQGPGTVYCWGAAATGQAGAGTPDAPIDHCLPPGFPDHQDTPRDPAGVPCLRQPAAVDGGIEFVSLSAGWDMYLQSTATPDTPFPTWQAEGHTCGIAMSGVAYCWGKNDFGQLGAPSDSVCQRAFSSFVLTDQPVSCRSHPAAVITPGAGTFRMVSAGSAHTCGIMTDGLAYCWGSNELGQLGDGAGGTDANPSPGTRRMMPAPIASERKFASISSGPDDACAVTDPDGSVFCWGKSYGSRPVRLAEPR